MKASTKGFRHGYSKGWYGRSQVGDQRNMVATALFENTINNITIR